MVAYNISGGFSIVEVLAAGMKTASLYNVFGESMQVLRLDDDNMEVEVSVYPVHIVLERQCRVRNSCRL